MSCSKLTATLREKIITDFLVVLRAQYVYPDLSEKIGDSLVYKLENEVYDSFDTSESFATKLTEDVQEVGFCCLNPVSKLLKNQRQVKICT